MDSKDRIWLPVDVASIGEAQRLVEAHRNNVGVFKLGLQILNAAMAQVFSPDVPEEVAYANMQAGRRLFAMLGNMYFHDGKWDDIPNTIEGVAIAVQSLHPAYVNVHASAGEAAVAKAVANRGGAMVLGVTVLTSLEHKECVSIFGRVPKKKVLSFARMLRDKGAQGIICSPQELEVLASDNSLRGLFKVTPGIRPDWNVYAEKLDLPAPPQKKDDQSRPLTPYEAIALGADALIIGRPITKPDVGTSEQVARLIRDEIADARRVA